MYFFYILDYNIIEMSKEKRLVNQYTIFNGLKGGIVFKKQDVNPISSI
jgi:hypothetical protein